MNAKGTAVKSIDQFVKEKFHPDYQNWLAALSEASRAIFREGVKTNQWYDVHTAVIEPTNQIMALFYDNDPRGAWESGRYSAETALKGIYKIYVKAANPNHIIDRASRAFAAYYTESDIRTANRKGKSLDFIIDYMPRPDRTIEMRIGGWIERALEISGCKDVQVKIEKSLVKGDSMTLYKLSWN